MQRVAVHCSAANCHVYEKTEGMAGHPCPSRCQWLFVRRKPLGKGQLALWHWDLTPPRSPFPPLPHAPACAPSNLLSPSHPYAAGYQRTIYFFHPLTMSESPPWWMLSSSR